MNKKLKQSETQGTVLTIAEQRLFAYLGNERQATSLARHMKVKLSAHCSDCLVSNEIIKVLVNALESLHGDKALEYIGGQRRDTLRSGT